MRRLLPSICLLAACSSDPARIDAPPTVTVYDRAMQSIDTRVLDAEGEPLDLPVRAVAVSDPAVVALGKNGELQCASYGDATVTLEAGEADGPTVRAETLMRCQLVKEIMVEPAKVAFTLKPDAQGVVRPALSDPLRIVVVGIDGQPIDQADVSVTSEDPTIARLEKGAVQARQRGATTIKVAAGDKVTEVPVEASLVVDDRLGLVIADGETHGIPVEAGTYRVTVGSDQPVEVSFQGADCESDEATAHTLDCTLEKGGTVRVENPAIFGMGGGPATLNIRLLQRP